MSFFNVIVHNIGPVYQFSNLHLDSLSFDEYGAPVFTHKRKPRRATPLEIAELRDDIAELFTSKAVTAVEPGTTVDAIVAVEAITVTATPGEAPVEAPAAVKTRTSKRKRSDACEPKNKKPMLSEAVQAVVNKRTKRKPL